MPASNKDPMTVSFLRKVLYGYLLLLVPLAWLAMKFDHYMTDGDGVAYMDIGDLLWAHRWSDAVNAYWHPLYPACLALARAALHANRWNELHAYFVANYVIYLVQVVAMLLFVRGLVRLRARLAPGADALLSYPALALIGLAMLVIAAMRELQLAKVGPDGLVQAFLLFGLGWLMESLAAEALGGAVGAAALMGASFGLAYLAKSFAFLLALLAIVVMAGFALLVQRVPVRRVAGTVVAAGGVFLLLAGPYIAALSHQKHRLTFGDSGSLNYVWYVSNTGRHHLEPWETDRFGYAKIHLLHPEVQLMRDPGIYSYKNHPLGTYPTWFDTSFFSDHITAKYSLRLLIVRDKRNAELAVRYILNHPETLVLLVLLLAAGASLKGRHRYAWPVLTLGVLMWCIYGLVNIEERYVTAAYIAVLLPLFASLRPHSTEANVSQLYRKMAAIAVVLMATLAMADMLRIELQERRDEEVAKLKPAWRDPQIYGAAEGLAKMGLKPGDTIACIGTTACLYDHYWARIAGVQILTEIWKPEAANLVGQMDAIPNRPLVYDLLKQEGARVLVGNFDPGDMTPAHPSSAGWLRLGQTNFYALPLTLAVSPGQP